MLAGFLHVLEIHIADCTSGRIVVLLLSLGDLFEHFEDSHIHSTCKAHPNRTSHTLSTQLGNIAPQHSKVQTVEKAQTTDLHSRFMLVQVAMQSNIYDRCCLLLEMKDESKAKDIHEDATC